MTTESRAYPNVSRSQRFILFLQLDGLCQALHSTLETQSPVSDVTVNLLKKLHDDLVRIVQGEPAVGFPSLQGATSADLLAYAQVARGTMLAFLTPEEIEEKRSIGFQV